METLSRKVHLLSFITKKFANQLFNSKFQYNAEQMYETKLFNSELGTYTLFLKNCTQVNNLVHVEEGAAHKKNQINRIYTTEM